MLEAQKLLDGCYKSLDIILKTTDQTDHNITDELNRRIDVIWDEAVQEAEKKDKSSGIL